MQVILTGFSLLELVVLFVELLQFLRVLVPLVGQAGLVGRGLLLEAALQDRYFLLTLGTELLLRWKEIDQGLKYVRN